MHYIEEIKLEIDILKAYGLKCKCDYDGESLKVEVVEPQPKWFEKVLLEVSSELDLRSKEEAMKGILLHLIGMARRAKKIYGILSATA